MYNQHIVTVPVALFLGAGASRPFGKMLMGEFIDHLEKQKGFRADRLFEDIVNSPAGQDLEPQRDLEHLFAELEEWSRKGYYQGSDAIAERPRGTQRPPMELFAERARLMLQNLRREVFEAYRDIQPAHRDKLIRHFEGLFGVLLKKIDPGKNPIVIFTTNYDPAAETLCQEKAGEYSLCDGFVLRSNAGSPVWRRESIDQLQVGATNRKDVALFKLHGSTSWFKRGRDFIKSDASIFVASDASFENLLIYPAKRKVALGDPYFTAYDYFQRTLENCKLCVVIGYSFRDYDALSRLRSAASYNQSLRVLVLDPGANALCRLLEKRGIKAQPLLRSFGDEASAQDYLTVIGDAVSDLS